MNHQEHKSLNIIIATHKIRNKGSGKNHIFFKEIELKNIILTYGNKN